MSGPQSKYAVSLSCVLCALYIYFIYTIAYRYSVLWSSQRSIIIGPISCCHMAGCHSTCHTDLVHVLFVANGHVQMELLPGKKRNFSHIWSDAVRMELGRNLIHKYSNGRKKKNTATTATADHTEWVYWTNTLCHSAKNRKTIFGRQHIYCSCIILFTCCSGTLYATVLISIMMCCAVCDGGTQSPIHRLFPILRIGLFDSFLLFVANFPFHVQHAPSLMCAKTKTGQIVNLCTGMCVVKLWLFFSVFFANKRSVCNNALAQPQRLSLSHTNDWLFNNKMQNKFIISNVSHVDSVPSYAII